MQTFIVRQPIMDNSNEVYGYNLLYNEGGEVRTTKQVTKEFESLLLQLDYEKILEGKYTLIAFTPTMIMRDIPHFFSLDKLIIQIDSSVSDHHQAIQYLKHYKKLGSRIALCNFEISPQCFSLIDIIDIIMLDLNDAPNDSLLDSAQIIRHLEKKIIAYNVNTQSAFDFARKIESDYITGSFVSYHLTNSVCNKSFIQSDFFQLMIAVTQDEPNIDEIEKLIMQDDSMTQSLLHLTHLVQEKEINNVRQALCILGLGQLKEWIYLLKLKSVEKESINLIKFSLERAYFCSNLLNYAKEMPITRSEAYLLGMFSTLDRLHGIPLEEAINALPLSKELTDVFVKREGRCAILLDLIVNYEKANWKQVEVCAEQLSIPLSIITQIYMECIKDVYDLLRHFYKENASFQ